MGDIILVRPGERIPVDGQILDGVTEVDESTITGDKVTVELTPYDLTKGRITYRAR